MTLIRNFEFVLYYTCMSLESNLKFTIVHSLSNMDWVQLAQYPFFDHRRSPSATQCDDIAQSITGATEIIPLNSFNTTTYSVICNNCSSLPLDRIVIFREAKAEPLGIFSYFALSWSNKQIMNPPELLYIRQAGIRHQLRQFKHLAPSVLPVHMIDELIQVLPTLFSAEYPSVLTNGNLSITNIRVDEVTCEITNIVDWSLAKVLPFGMDLDVLFLVTGYMGLRNWRDYECKQFMLDCFWDGFWASVKPHVDRGRVRMLAEKAAMIGALLRYGFTRREDGTSDSVVSVSDRDSALLRAWFGVAA